MTGTRLNGKIFKNEKINKKSFLIDCILWVGLFSFAGYYFFPHLYFKFIFIQINVGVGLILGVLFAYFENQWDIPYVTAGYILLGHAFLHLSVCWLLSNYLY